MNGTTQRALSKLVGQRPETWDEHLDAVMFGLRTKKQMTTKCSPYFLMFGREARYPSEVPDHYMVDGSVEDVVGQETLTEEILHLEDTLKEAREKVTRAQEKTRQRLKSSGKIIFKVGDKVWRQNKRSQQRKGGKLEANFLGPFPIKSLQGKSADLQGEKGPLIHKTIGHCVCWKTYILTSAARPRTCSSYTYTSILTSAACPRTCSFSYTSILTSAACPRTCSFSYTSILTSAACPRTCSFSYTSILTSATCPRTCSFSYTSILTSATCPRTCSSYKPPDPDSTRENCERRLGRE
ncbi:hypothetical protein CesoFtcFv8_014333 [Champsocephalus esox]|uniref:Uncharacterized protein n=1 Tax=Champsocephalus esox TaxID=159716 RepID=A0AAN8BT16_9TELE|nr:hypothetical protein CesoFtcFv8_014333 [Champsocephalus esox]